MMTPETKRWAWIGGLAAGATALVGAIVFWPKKASAQTSPPQKGYVKYASTWSSPVFPAKIGETLTIALPALQAPLSWHVEGAEQLYEAKEIPEGALITFTHRGAGTIFVSKINQQRQGVEPAMAVNVNVT